MLKHVAARCGLLALALIASLAAASSAHGAIVINEVESQPVDWVELYNTGAAAEDISGYGIDDDSDGGTRFIIPPGTTIPAGGFYTTPDAPVGLGNPDAVRLFNAAGPPAQIDSFSYGPHAARTYGRCPDGTGELVQTLAATRNAPNSCIPAATAPWPGGPDVAVASTFNFGPNLSGLAYQPSGTSARGVLWASRNNATASLFRLLFNGTTWEPDAANGWANGKQLFFPDGAGVPDAEGITIAGDDPGAIYASIERNDILAEENTPRPGILRFAVTGAEATLTATKEWPLAADLPAVTDSNGGLEAITWVPDAVLVAKGFRNEATGTTYSPAVYPDHGSGLFFVGVEQTGQVIAYAVNRTAGTTVRIATIESGFPAVMSLDFEAETGLLRAGCDDTCDGRSATFDVAAAGADAGKFVRTAIHARPAGMPNLNNEGFASTPQAECVGGKKPAFWADDSNVGATALRTGTLNCTVLPPVVTPTPTPTATATATATPPPSVTPDTTKPKLSKVKASRKAVAFTLSEAARVQVTIDRRARKGKPFKRVVRFTAQQEAGARKISFKGRVAAKRLKSGTLRVTLQATDAAGNRSAPARGTVAG